MGSLFLRLWLALTLLFVAAPVLAQQPQPQPPPQSDVDPQRKEARDHFDRGVERLSEESWDAALAEFLLSRKLYPTKAATKNAALCLQKLKRYDEALDMFESLLREFPSLTDEDHAFADRSMTQLRAVVGTITIGTEPGASISVDGRERGNAPLQAPVRVSAGSHVVRAYKTGFVAFEQRVEVAGRQNVTVDARLRALAQSGRLRVAEQSGKAIDVVVDNVVVGKTPWEDALPVGEHTVVLRGDNNLGTQPVSAPVRLNETTKLNLAAEPLEAELRVEPTPLSAVVAIDAVSVGRGLWEGRLRAGGHQVEIAAEGFLPIRRAVNVGKGKREVVSVTLDRDPNSPLWRAANPPHFFVDISGGVPLAPGLGGDVAGSGFGFGGIGQLRIGYQLGSGLGFALDVGYAMIKQSTTGRSDTLIATGNIQDQGTSNDDITMKGLLLGPSFSIHRGEGLTFMFRVGAGAWLATAQDTRSGTFTTSSAMGASLHPDGTMGTPAPYPVGPVQETTDARYLYLAPEVRIGGRIGSHFELSAGVQAMLLVALTQPKWGALPNAIITGNCSGTTPDPMCVRDGAAQFGASAITGRTILVISPGLGARYEF